MSCLSVSSKPGLIGLINLDVVSKAMLVFIDLNYYNRLYFIHHELLKRD